MKHLNSKTSSIALGVAGALVATSAFAVDPTYTSQIGDALEAVNMTDLIADVSAFAAMGFTLLLATKGILFVSRLLGKFLR